MFPDGGHLTQRPAALSDRPAIHAMVQREQHVHTHLDWQAPEEWLGQQPFLLAERGRRAVGALACPPSPADTAWIRLFAVVDGVAEALVWNLLWPTAKEELIRRAVQMVAVVSLDDWLEPLCRSGGFEQTHAVVVLARAAGPAAEPAPDLAAAIRPAGPDDAPALLATDSAAFGSPWQMSAEVMGMALSQADYVTLAEVAGQVAGYQLTTPSQGGAHLARLAVRPEFQGKGLGAALVANALNHYHYHARGLGQITVNTQDTNAASLALYRRLGFRPTGTRFPVYQLALV